MDTVINEYEKYLKKQRLSDNTFASYMRDLGNFRSFLESAGNPSLTDVDSAVLREYIDDMHRNGRANSTIARSVAALRKFYHYLFRKKYITVDPTYGIDMPKPEKSIPGFISAADVARLLDMPKATDLKGCRDKAMLELLYATGIKVSELISLECADVDLRSNMLSCRGRYIPLGKEASESLNTYIKKARSMMTGGSAEKTFFVNCSGKPLTRQGFWKILRGYAEVAGIKSEINAQTLRHSFALHLLQNGADISAVSEMLGHKDVATTRRYNQVLKENIKKIYKKAHPRA